MMIFIRLGRGFRSFLAWAARIEEEVFGRVGAGWQTTHDELDQLAAWIIPVQRDGQVGPVDSTSAWSCGTG